MTKTGGEDQEEQFIIWFAFAIRLMQTYSNGNGNVDGF